MTTQLEPDTTDLLEAGAGTRVLWLTTPDVRSARRLACTLTDVLGLRVDLVAAESSMYVRDLDARAAVDVLAELVWAGVTPDSFALT